MSVTRKCSARRALSAMGAVAVVLLLLSPGSVAGQSADTASGGGSRTATATLVDANGATVGKVVLAPVSSSTAVGVRVTGIPAGFHGFHIHAVGVCQAPFTTAGGHHNPGGGTHRDHAGDLPSLLVQGNGSANAAVQTDRFTVDSLFDADGSAVILHADPDNFAHIPSRYVSSTTGQPGPDTATLATGDAGARIACGVITR